MNNEGFIPFTNNVPNSIIKTIFLAMAISSFQIVHLFAADNAKVLMDIQKRGVKVTQETSSTYRFEYPHGKVLYKNLGEYHNEILHRTTTSIDTTTIDLTSIDTALYSNKYQFWQEIDVSDADFSPVVIGDVNNNKRVEIYGFDKEFSSVDDPPNDIFEIDSTGVFKN